MVAAGLSLTVGGCSPATPIYDSQAAAAPMGGAKATLFLDFVAENLPRNLTGQILPLQMILVEIDPTTGERTASPSWSVGLCLAQALGCESGDVKTLKLELPPGVYGVGYIGSTGFSAPWYYLMAFDGAAARGGDVLVGGLTVTPDFDRRARLTPQTPILDLRAGEAGYAGVLKIVYGPQSLATSFAQAPERKATLLARTGLSERALVDRPGHYR